MPLVNVLINLPSTSLNKYFTYHVPEALKEEVQFGRRVLVELGHKKVEAFVVAEDVPADDKEKNYKSVIKVLDTEPIFDQTLFKLAEWMADTYICPLSTALNSILPRILNRKTSRVLIVNITEDEAADSASLDIIEQYYNFFSFLWQNGEVTLEWARKEIGQEAVDILLEKGLVVLSGTYSGYRLSKDGYKYTAGTEIDSQAIEQLRKKAPRQAEAMDIIMKPQGIACEELERRIPKKSILALINKGYIQIVRQNNESIKKGPELSSEQQTAVKTVIDALGKYKEFLLYGVTGSGKTEVYIAASQACINQGKTVLILVPEIALTRHLVDVFSERIEDITILHSGMPWSERYREWLRIKRGEVKLVLGTRSAVFAPLSDLGLIIIDEEQEHTYKQEENPRYHAVEAARERGRLESAVVLAGSATPSIETFYRAMTGDIQLLELKNRVGGAQMPVVYIEDMKQIFRTNQYHNSFIVSPVLRKKLADCISRGEQSILFINRRGYSPVTLCRECGYVAKCPHCSVSLTYHLDIDSNLCHYCNYQEPIRPECPVCGSKHVRLFGYGTQRVEEEVKRLLPQARVARLDLDSSRKKGFQSLILKQMQQGKIDILVGTQMVAKGLDFPSVSLVGIIDADSMLNIPDFRANERAFQLLVQSAGRAGRGNLPGEVFIQTFNPDNPVLRLAITHDYASFYYNEIKQRKLLNYPPFTYLLRIVIAGEELPRVKDVSRRVALSIEEITDANEENIEILGPAACPLQIIRNKYRFQILVKCDNMLLLKSIGKYIKKSGTYQKVSLEIDINPVGTM